MNLVTEEWYKEHLLPQQTDSWDGHSDHRCEWDGISMFGIC